MQGDIVIVKGGGDIASGIIQKLHRTGFRVLVLEIEHPTSIRRTVCFSEAIYNKEMIIEGLKGVLVRDKEEIFHAWDCDNIPVIVDPNGIYIDNLKPVAVVDAIIAKRNIGMKKDLAPITIGVGPGFIAGVDVDVVIESNRGHNLGRIIFEGSADKNTGKPGEIGGYTSERVLYSPYEGVFTSDHKIGDFVKKGEVIAYVNDGEIVTEIDGLLRGLLRNGSQVTKGFKLADVDPRIEEISNCHTISDKARAIGGAVLEALLMQLKSIK